MGQYLKPKTLKWLKEKEWLNEAEAKLLINDVERLHKEHERLKTDGQKLVRELEKVSGHLEDLCVLEVDEHNHASAQAFKESAEKIRRVLTIHEYSFRP